MASATLSGENYGLQVGDNRGSITATFYASAPEDIGRLCLRRLRCPSSLKVKDHLKLTKDKLLPQSFKWVLETPEYCNWRDGEDVALLWIKGGAGKGKTMMSIGLIEELTRTRHDMVIYSFCQNADNALNTLESIVKGLIFQLANKETSLNEALRRRWDAENNQFTEDMTLWHNLWNILMEMLDQCQSSKIFIIVDALDECQDNGMGDFFKRLVRTGLDQPAKIKWLLTSRPLDSAERALLISRDQIQVSLDLNSEYVSKAVEAYISHKVDELSRLNRYRKSFSTEVKSELTTKAEGTFLWVSLVCQRLESVSQDDVMSTIRNLPPGLHPFYDRILNQLSTGEPDDVKQCMRLLQAMMLAYRPLKIQEVESVTGLIDEEDDIQTLVNRSASFIRMHGQSIEFVHQSARDYLAGDGQSILSSVECFGHDEIVQCCLPYLSERLKVNLHDLSQPDSSRNPSKTQSLELSCLDYAATFWVQHLGNIKEQRAQSCHIENGAVGIFLYKRFLEWLECLSLLDQLPKAIEALGTLLDLTKDDSSVSLLVRDATRFLLRHYHTIMHWPLQIYSSAIIFSPTSSIVKRENSHKIPVYLINPPITEKTWGPLIQTLEGHSGFVNKIAFSPDGTKLVSCSADTIIKLWDPTTGGLQNSLKGHSDNVATVVFSMDGTFIASGSRDNTIKLWNASTGDLEKTLEGHTGWVWTLAFSPDGTKILSGSLDSTIKLWDTVTGDLQMTLEGHSDSINIIALSPDGMYIASGSRDKTIKLWDIATGALQKTLEGHTGWVWTLAFSPDGTQIVSGSFDKTINIWDTTTGALQKTLKGHLDIVTSVWFTEYSMQIVSGSMDKTVRIWDTTTGDLKRTLEGHLGAVMTICISPDGTKVASGSMDKTVKLWDIATGDLQKTLEGHSDMIITIAFSLDGMQIASGSYDKTTKFWDIGVLMDDLHQTRENHSEHIRKVMFSPDGMQIASNSNDKTVKLWDTLIDDQQKTLRQSDYIWTMAFSPDSTQIALGSFDHSIKLWDIATGDLQKTLEGHSDKVTSIVFSADSIVSGSMDNSIKLWDTRTGSLQKTFEGHTGWVNAVAVSPDGKQLASGSADKTIKLWDIASGDLQKTLEGHSDSVNTVAFSPDGMQIAGSDDEAIRIWDIRKTHITSRFLDHYLSSGFKLQPRKDIKTSDSVFSLKYSADAQYLITDIGRIACDGLAMDGQEKNHLELRSRFVKEQWIYFENQPFLRLPSDFQPTSYDVQGDCIAIGFKNGHVLKFEIDRRILHSILPGRSPRERSLPPRNLRLPTNFFELMK